MDLVRKEVITLIERAIRLTQGLSEKSPSHENDITLSHLRHALVSQKESDK